MKTRKGQFGATLDVGKDTIYCARPGFRIWRSNLAGKVIILIKFDYMDQIINMNLNLDCYFWQLAIFSF